MPTPTKYTFSIASDTANGAVNSDTLTSEVRASAIVIALDFIGTDGDVLDIWFKDALSSGDETILDGVVGAHEGAAPVAAPLSVSLAGPKSALGAPKFEMEPRRGDKLQLYTHNFAKKETWASTSTRFTGVSMVNTDGGTGAVWALPTPATIVDLHHGKAVFEADTRATYEHKVYVDGVHVPVHTAEGGHNFVCDYLTGEVTFTTPVPGAAVTVDYSKVNSSVYVLSPLPGKNLVLLKAELQFSVDSGLRDTFQFIVRAQVDKFPPLFPYWNANPLGAPGPYPAGTSLPIKTLQYETFFDLVAESNLAYPIIQKNAPAVPNWRDLPANIQVLAWAYADQATIELSSALGMDIVMKMTNDIPCEGSIVLATFYGLSENET
jgi:hypothetical protein